MLGFCNYDNWYSTSLVFFSEYYPVEEAKYTLMLISIFSSNKQPGLTTSSFFNRFLNYLMLPSKYTSPFRFVSFFIISSFAVSCSEALAFAGKFS